MPAPIGFTRDRLRGFAATNNHVEMLINELVYQGRHGCCVIGGIAINHDEYVSINICEHSSNNVPLASQWHANHDGSLFASHLHSVIRRIVVEYIDLNARHCLSKVLYYLSNRYFFIVAGRNESHFQAAIRHVVSFTVCWHQYHWCICRYESWSPTDPFVCHASFTARANSLRLTSVMPSPRQSR
ncbi:hypothetical protein D3C81_1691330 [compost metagenome]